MGYKIVITESAAKELKRIPAKMQDRIFEKIEGLVEEPKPNGHKKLKNFDMPGNDYNDYYRIRVGDYRVIYAIEDAEITIFVMKVAHRKNVYE
ncbi:type II toxin-antitoxin system RelE/ParE family toxin [Spirosoma sp.]|uniref:type II toxin-antitoxin system RelE family toxin n=1 Tax=Spirosoma sp. TaxID=1899569 RepID=UPI0026071A2C|nr:type II toxin-antitoxin system RelE/ParE family toxin [Spirosoma sp.]MCX6212879.1 type II toxin-antitoxin system RelE/ParE family toxin [Spirosoma sp.]